MNRIDAEYYSPSQAAARLGISRQGIRFLMQKGRVPARLTPNGRLYPRGAIDRLAEDRQVLREAKAGGS